MARRWPMILSLLAAAAALCGPPAMAQAGRVAPHPPLAGGTPDPAPLRVPDRVWSTRPSPASALPASGGVVVVTPNVVLGWGGLPPSGPVVQPTPGGPGHPAGWQPGAAPVPRPPGGLVVPVPGGPGHPAGPATLHRWRNP